MALGIGGGAAMGLAFEVTPGTWVTPTKWFPFSSESLTYTQETQWRRPIRRAVGVIGAVAGNAHVEGDLEMEALEDVVPYFLSAARCQVVETGSTPNFIYTATPTANAIPAKTLSLTLERVTGQSFGYTGMVVSSFVFTVQDGMLMFNCSMMGRDEASQSIGVPVFPTTTPFGAGQYQIEIPTGSTVTDTDTFEFTVEDNAEPQFRLKSTSRGAEFIKYGERNCTLTVERDFLTRADYDAFKALTAQSVTLTATKGANNSIAINMPVAVKNTYEIPVPGQGELVRANIEYQGVSNASGVDYTIVIKTQEDLPA
jgi:hypothetical protein